MRELLLRLSVEAMEQQDVLEGADYFFWLGKQVAYEEVAREYDIDAISLNEEAEIILEKRRLNIGQ